MYSAKVYITYKAALLLEGLELGDVRSVEIDRASRCSVFEQGIDLWPDFGERMVDTLGICRAMTTGTGIDEPTNLGLQPIPLLDSRPGFGHGKNVEG